MNELMPYPEKKPTKNGSYLCQIGASCFEIMHWKNDAWLERDWCPFDESMERVHAWCEFPEPRKISAKNSK